MIENYKQVTNLTTGETVQVALTAEELAQRSAKAEAWTRDVLPGLVREKVERNRAAAYAAEADPLFFKVQRGEATMDQWTAKVAEIRSRYPYPGDAE